MKMICVENRPVTLDFAEKAITGRERGKPEIGL